MSKAALAVASGLALLMSATLATAQVGGGAGGAGSAGGAGGATGGATGGVGGLGGAGTATSPTGVGGLGNTGGLGTTGGIGTTTGLPATGTGSQGTLGTGVIENGTDASGTGAATRGNPQIRGNVGGRIGNSTVVSPMAPTGGTDMTVQPNGVSGAGKATGSSGTYGRKSTGGSAESLGPQARRQIREAVDRTNAPIVGRSFITDVGMAVPRTVTLHPLPSSAVSAVPAYRNYTFVRMSNRVLIVDPATRIIVEVVRG